MLFFFFPSPKKKNGNSLHIDDVPFYFHQSFSAVIVNTYRKKTLDNNICIDILFFYYYIKKKDLLLFAEEDRDEVVTSSPQFSDTLNRNLNQSSIFFCPMIGEGDYCPESIRRTVIEHDAHLSPPFFFNRHTHRHSIFFFFLIKKKKFDTIFF